MTVSVEDARAHAMCWHHHTKKCWQRLDGPCVALLLLRQCRQPNIEAEAWSSRSRSDSKRLHSTAAVSSRVRSRVVKPWSLCRLFCLAFLSSVPRTDLCIRQSGSTCGERIGNDCVFARTVAQKSRPTPRL